MMPTFSICPSCYKKIPAAIEITESGVFLHKKCGCGAETVTCIEKDADFYRKTSILPYRNTLGNTVNIAITDRCNTSCRACYSPRGENDLSVHEVLGLARSAPHFVTKTVLTGGEPTEHPAFFDIVSQLDSGLITNGINFADLNFLKEYVRCRVFGTQFNELHTMFSLNVKGTQGYSLKLQALDNIRSLGLRTGILVATVHDLAEVPAVLEEFKRLKDVSSTFKIRFAFDIGEYIGNAPSYLSELCSAAGETAEIIFKFIPDLNNNNYLLNFNYDGLHLILVNCPNVHTVDLQNIAPTGPYQYTAVRTFEDVMVALIIDEGIRKGWFDGRPIS